MQRPGPKCFGGFLATALLYLIITGITVTVAKGHSRKTGVLENAEWIATSHSWVDRQLCTWLELCGTAHLNSRKWVWDSGRKDDPPRTPPPSDDDSIPDFWHSGDEDPDKWSDEERQLRDIPQYVLDYAPYVHLFSGEQFWPCDLSEHLLHTHPYLNYTTILDLGHDVNLTNLDELNDYEGADYGRYIYLQSDDNVEERPKWLGGAKNIPTPPQVLPEGDGEIIWPHDDYGGAGPDGELDPPEQASREPMHAQGSMKAPSDLPKLVPSTNGRCGGNSGFTCKASEFGPCCSIYGWCGKGEAYCGEACEGLAGECNNPFEPRPHPHTDLRRRGVETQTVTTIPVSSKPSLQIGRSSAPAILVVVPKDDDVVDAFWFFFYSYNLGQTVFNIRFGNHVGDWEHTLIRFRNGKPQSVFLSEHDFGDAYHYQALEKYIPNPDGSDTMIGTWSNDTAARLAKRPVVYSAVGSHAMYATPGLHPYVLPWGLLHDQTDRGPLWDPSLNFQSYTYNPLTNIARSSNLTPKAPVNWFNFGGHWGDKYYPLPDPRQYRFAGQYHYVNGPLGPRFKNLGRKKVCQGGRRCHIRDWLDESGTRKPRIPAWEEEDVEDGGLPGGNITDDRTSFENSG